MKNIPIYFIVGFSTICIGCTHLMAPKQRLNKFNDYEYNKYRIAGTGSVSGQAFLRQQGGGVVYGAGSEVILLPRTAYTGEIVNREVLRSTKLMPPIDTRLPILKTQADGQGNYSFINLTYGDYYVGCDIIWYVSGRRQGGPVMMIFSLAPGEHKRVMITK